MARVLVLGSGAREHALAARLLQSAGVTEVLVAPGNAGTALHDPARIRNVAGEPLELARSLQPDLVVVGPEAPLVDGIVDRLAAAGILAFGPGAAAARLEGSKAFMKQIAAAAGIPTARHVVVRDLASAERAIEGFAAAPVVKADGLCAGKGVVVAESRSEALAAAREMLEGGVFGDAGRTVVLEERIEGEEASVHAVADGERFVLLPAAQDHKRLGDGDRGPNTGGMGAYAPAPLVTPALAEAVGARVVGPALRALREVGAPFRGALFAGLMIRPTGDPVLLEFNVRFGDPETEVLMAATDGDLFEVLAGAARGRLPDAATLPVARHAVCVVVAAAGYPGVPRRGDRVGGLDEAARVPGVSVYHAGTALEQGEVRSSGGRVLAVTACGASLREAHARAYQAADRVTLEGRQLRRDIAARALPQP
ncbi:MAG: phosphoribosylamine--glycine ligase [Polyangiaceae bacterium]|nr:phosphoribosylamine--glycine ligase [Polyangiaceae bacterium]